MIIHKSAIISQDKKYRYLLTRVWNRDKGGILFILLNPSIADADIDDPTIKKCINIAINCDKGYIEVVNLFAYRATNPKVMKSYIDPIGKENDKYIIEAANKADIIVLGWGEKGDHLNRDSKVLSLLCSEKVYSLCLNKSGKPKHPLYCKRNSELIKYHIQPSCTN